MSQPRFNPSITLEQVRSTLQDFATERDWDQFHTPRNLLLALVGEVGELSEIFQWKAEVKPGLPSFTPEERKHVAEELSDCLLYLIRMADRCQIDLATSCLNKVKANAKKYPADKARGSSKKYHAYAADGSQPSFKERKRQQQQEQQKTRSSKNQQQPKAEDAVAQPQPPKTPVVAGRTPVQKAGAPPSTPPGLRQSEPLPTKTPRRVPTRASPDGQVDSSIERCSTVAEEDEEEEEEEEDDEKQGEEGGKWEPECTATQLQALQRVEAAVVRSKTTLGLGKSALRRELARFLTAQNWDAKAALKAFAEYVAWRKRERVATILDSPVPDAKLIEQCVPAAFHGVDKEGFPVYLEQTGRIHCAALAENVTAKSFLRQHIYGVELLRRRMREQTSALGRPVEQFTSILDLDGLGLGHRAVISYLQACAEVDAKYYPGIIRKVLIVNSPWVMPGLYNLVQAFLPKDVQDGVQILSGKPGVALLEHIPPEHIPAEYGGECKCGLNNPGGKCVPHYPAPKAADVQRERDAAQGLELVDVGAGATARRELLTGPEGGTVTWFMEVQDGYDVEFSVDVQAEGQPLAKAKLPSRCTTNQGAYEAAGACKVVLRWNNSYSYFRGKSVKFKGQVN